MLKIENNRNDCGMTHTNCMKEEPKTVKTLQHCRYIKSIVNEYGKVKTVEKYRNTKCGIISDLQKITAIKVCCFYSR